MPLKPDTLALTCLLALLTSLGPLSTDMYLPSLPAMEQVFGADSASVQLTLSVFLGGFAFGQLFYGPLSDRLGRKPVILSGLMLYMVASLFCLFAPTVEALMVGRFFQALGASGPIVLARSVVRDLYTGDRAGRELARMGAVMGLVPALAPVLGGLLETGFGWQASFWAMTVFGLCLFTATRLGLSETLRHKASDPLSPFSVLRSYRIVGRNRVFVSYASMSSCTYAGLFAFISGSSFVLQQNYGLSELQYGFSFSICALAYVVGTFMGTALSSRFSAAVAFLSGGACLAAGGLFMIIGAVWLDAYAMAIIGPMMVYTTGVGIILPQSTARALMPLPERAGAASSFLGFSQMTLGALVGVVTGWLLYLGPVALASVIACLGTCVLVLTLMRPRLSTIMPDHSASEQTF